MYESDNLKFSPLIIDYDYGILHSASGQIARVFWQKNAEKQFDPVIVCSKADTSLCSRSKLIQIEDNLLVRYMLALFRKLGLSDLSHLPDVKRFSWMPPVLRFFSNKPCFKYDYVHSISCPDSSHLIAMELKRMYGLPWVAQFNDPWINNEAKRYKFEFFRRKAEIEERLVAENADLIIHSNEVIYQDWIDRYGDLVVNKMTVIPLSYNIPQLPEVGPIEKIGNKIRIFHIGHIYGQRSARSFFDAVAELKRNNLQAYYLLEVYFIGSISDNEVNYAYSLGIHDVVHVLGVMPPEELDKYYRMADIFLVIDMNVDKSPSFPSKLMLYHYWRKPIIGITTQGSAIKFDLEASGHRAFLFDDVTSMSEYLLEAIINYQGLCTFDKDYWQKFTVERVTQIYKYNLLQMLER